VFLGSGNNTSKDGNCELLLPGSLSRWFNTYHVVEWSSKAKVGRVASLEESQNKKDNKEEAGLV
jgi:hypothetical protein